MITPQPKTESGLRVAHVFLEHAEFAHAGDALSLPGGTTANVGDVSVRLETGTTTDKRRGFARVTVQTKPENKPTYQFSVCYVAVIERTGEGGLDLEKYLKTTSPLLVYPFLREALANLTMRARFGPIWLAPLNLAAFRAGDGNERGAEERKAPRRPKAKPPKKRKKA